MGRASREKRERRDQAERIRNGEEAPMDQSKLTQKVQKEILYEAKDEATRKVDALAAKWAKMDLTGQVKAATGMARRAGLMEFRRQFLPGFQEDLGDKIREGATADSIMKYYYGCSQFVSFWEKIVGKTKEDLLGMIPVSQVETEKDAAAVSAPTSTDDAEVSMKKPSFIRRVRNLVTEKKQEAIAAQVNAGTTLKNRTLSVFDAMLERKIAAFKKHNYPITVERMMMGSESLHKLGLTDEDMRSRVVKRLEAEKKDDTRVG